MRRKAHRNADGDANLVAVRRGVVVAADFDRVDVDALLALVTDDDVATLLAHQVTVKRIALAQPSARIRQSVPVEEIVQSFGQRIALEEGQFLRRPRRKETTDEDVETLEHNPRSRKAHERPPTDARSLLTISFRSTNSDL